MRREVIQISLKDLMKVRSTGLKNRVRNFCKEKKMLKGINCSCKHLNIFFDRTEDNIFQAMILSSLLPGTLRWIQVAVPGQFSVAAFRILSTDLQTSLFY